MTQINAFAAEAERLVQRLDVCWNSLGETSPLRPQALIYAGFLSDVVAGRIDSNGSEVGEMLQLVGEFCGLVEAEQAENVI
jgi:hypothetical protein